MRYSRHLVSLRTYGLAFAIVLSPAFIRNPWSPCMAPMTSASQTASEVVAPDDPGTAAQAESAEPSTQVLYTLSEQA
jgi:hypothetical protein